MNIKLPTNIDEERVFLLRLVEVTPGGCWNWIRSVGSAGYGNYGNTEKGTRRASHRASYEAFNGPIENDLWVLHKCDNPRCINPFHLYLGTYDDNARDRQERGRNSHGKKHAASIRSELRQGEKNNAARLTDAQVVEIIERRHRGDRLVDVALAFGVSISTISRISRGERWLHIPRRAAAALRAAAVTRTGDGRAT